MIRLNRLLTALVVCGAALPAEAQQKEALTVVSAASYQHDVSPNSLASVFGQNLAGSTTSARLDQNGLWPTAIDGTTVTVNGKAAGLLYVSPSVINFILPADVSLGNAQIKVNSPGSSTPLEGSVMVSQVAPGVFTLPCLRVDTGAVRNSVTSALEPFRATTSENPIADKRTRLSIYATGIQYSGNPSRDPKSINVAETITATVTDSRGHVTSLPVEYAGPSQAYPGVDLINAIVPPELEGAGLVTVGIQSGTIVSNPVSVVLSPAMAAGIPADLNFNITTVAGTGSPGSGGDNGSALEAQLQSPTAVVLDKQHNLYVATGSNHTVRKISADGVITTVAGTGIDGSSGDGGPANQAQLRNPVSLAVDASGNLYIVDADDNKVRRVSPEGIITTFAGTGAAGFSGDGHMAASAQLSSPASVAINPSGTVYIADTGNNRIRRITADNLIDTFAGTGTAGLAGDQGVSYLAELNAPQSLAVGADGSVYVSDTGNRRIRRIAPDGIIQTIAGGAIRDTLGSSLSFDNPIALSINQDQQLFLSDGANAQVQGLDSACRIGPVAGNATSGFLGDGGPATQARLNSPAGSASDSFGDLFLADSKNNRVRKLSRGSCSLPATMILDPSIAQAGATVTGTVRLGCPTPDDNTLSLSGNSAGVQIPPTVRIPAGQTYGSFSFPSPSNLTSTAVHLTAKNPMVSADATLLAEPMSAVPASMTGLKLRPSVQFGASPVTGLVTLSTPAPPGGSRVTLQSDNPAALVADGITVAPGQVSAEFAVITSPVQQMTNADITATMGSSRLETPLKILPVGQADIGSLSLAPPAVAGGQSSTGTVTLAETAPPAGVQVNLLSNNPAASVPSSVTVPGGRTTATFPVSTSPLSSPMTALLTAASANTVSAALSINPESGGSTGTINSWSVSPSTLTGGQGSTGTVTLSAPAPAGGVQVTLSSDNSAASVPASVTVLSGQTSATVTVSTSSVSSPVAAALSAFSANSASVVLSIIPASGGSTGTITSWSVSPSTVTGGQGSTGTVNLSAPAPAGGVQVSLSSDNSAASVPTSVTVPVGQTSATVAVSTSAVSSPVAVTLMASSANSGLAGLTINPASGGSTGTITSWSVSPSSVTGGQGSSGTVTLSAPAPAGGVHVSLSSDNSAASVPASVTVPAGQTSAAVAVSTSAVSSPVSATLTAFSANSASAVLSINPAAAPCVGSVDLSTSSVLGGQSLVGTVTLTSAARAGGEIVNLTSSKPSASVPTTVTVAPGQNSANFAITTSPVAALDSPMISASSGACATSSATLSVLP